jgi:NAD(P)H-flavin reductase
MSQVSCCGLMPATRGPMLAGIRHRPFPLRERELMCSASPDGSAPAVIRLTFGLSQPQDALGFGQPNTAVKVRPPGAWLRSRPYSISSGPECRGSFQLLVKLYPGGRVSGHLGSLRVGESAWFARTRTKPMAEGVRRAGLIAFGVGISDCLHTATALLQQGSERVALLYAARCKSEALLQEELEALASAYPDRFSVTYFFSREIPTAASPVGGAGVRVVYGRLEHGALVSHFGSWAAEDSGRLAGHCAFLSVGTKAMNRQTYSKRPFSNASSLSLCPCCGWQWHFVLSLCKLLNNLPRRFAESARLGSPTGGLPRHGSAPDNGTGGGGRQSTTLGQQQRGAQYGLHWSILVVHTLHLLASCVGLARRLTYLNGSSSSASESAPC